MAKWILLIFAGVIIHVQALEKIDTFISGKGGEAESVARFPSWSPDGKWIAFSLYGDIWKVSDGGGKAIRLTFDTSEDVKPRWAPDGKKIAFSSNRKGNFDVWTIPADGGAPTQITYHSVWDSISDWTPDGKWIIFYSYRSGSLELWKISSKGGMALQITFDGGRDATVSHDGSKIVYCRGDVSLWQKGYRGSSNWNIYSLSLKKKDLPKQLTSFEGNDLYPAYSIDGKYIYYLREQDVVKKEGKKSPVYNLWRMSASGEDPVQVTSFSSDIIAPGFSRDGKKIVFEKDFRIWQMNIGDAEAKQVAITVPVDVSSSKKITRVLTEGNEMGDWSRDGQYMVFVLDGDIWMMPSQGGSARQITSGAGKDQWPRFSPDGKSIAYFSDKSGNDEIYVLNLATSREYQLTHDKHGDFYHSWSPDGKNVLFTSERSGNRDIWLIPSSGGTAVQLTDSPESEDDAVFSPDGRWIAFDSGKSGHQEIWVMPAKQGFAEAVQLTKKSLLTQVPTWSPDSRWIACETNDNQGGVSLWVLPREGGQSMQLAVNASMPSWSHDGKWIMYESGRERKKNIYRIKAPEEVYVGEKIPFVAQIEMDLKQERERVFEEAWLAISQGFYDPKFHGVDWQKVKEKYRRAVVQAQTDLEFDVLLNRMVGELKASHTGISGSPVANEVETGYLGWELEPWSGKKVLQVKKLLKDGPADKVWVRRGDFVFQIGESIVSRDTNIPSLLNGKVGKKVKVFVSPSLDPEQGRYLSIVPVGLQKIQSLKYQQQLLERVRIVRKRCRGRVVYIHLTEMNEDNLRKFGQVVQQTISRAEGMIIDVRDNGGGLIHRELLEILQRRPYVSYRERGQKERKYQPALYWDKPVVVLINERSFSDAEVFAYAFKELGLGYLVGVPTAGGVIGTRDITLANQSTFRVPRVGYYSLEGENLEGMGVKPDFLIVETAQDRAKNQDPQLIKATEVIMSEITRRKKEHKTGGKKKNASE